MLSELGQNTEISKLSFAGCRKDQMRKDGKTFLQFSAVMDSNEGQSSSIVAIHLPGQHAIAWCRRLCWADAMLEGKLPLI
ncbi:hypothetical protein R1flu_023176 [Riccia fluitans]|uniref:Uncharacterized protein n=1 Tax=Riccia fluitans TaxID=41844 RepID=A0ABD1XR95_9MARC